MNGGTEYAYDPDLPFVAVGKSTKMPYARFNSRGDAERFYPFDCDVIDTTPKPKIPEDAQHITWGKKNVAYSRINDRWYGWTDAGLSEGALLGLIGDAEVTVLVPKEES